MVGRLFDVRKSIFLSQTSNFRLKFGVVRPALQGSQVKKRRERKKPRFKKCKKCRKKKKKRKQLLCRRCQHLLLRSKTPTLDCSSASSKSSSSNRCTNSSSRRGSSSSSRRGNTCFSSLSSATDRSSNSSRGGLDHLSTHIHTYTHSSRDANCSNSRRNNISSSFAVSSSFSLSVLFRGCWMATAALSAAFAERSVCLNFFLKKILYQVRIKFPCSAHPT